MGATSLRSDADFSGTRLARPAIGPGQAGQSAPIQGPNMGHEIVDSASRPMLLHKFATRSVDHVSALSRALDSGNAAELAQQAHTVKALAADLDAPELHARAGELEQTALSGDLEQAGLALVRTREEIERCVETVGNLIKQWSGEPSNGERA